MFDVRYQNDATWTVLVLRLIGPLLGRSVVVCSNVALLPCVYWRRYVTAGFFPSFMVKDSPGRRTITSPVGLGERVFWYHLMSLLESRVSLTAPSTICMDLTPGISDAFCGTAAVERVLPWGALLVLVCWHPAR